MKRTVVHVALGGLALTGIGLGLLNSTQAIGAELKGFAINTQEKDKAVTITLFTDQRVPYATEHQGKQFSIVLPNTQISPEQLSNGLPVVVDNKNRFIGRAVPIEDGKVRIVLPNLSANDYAVSIQQKRTGEKPVVHQAAKPRPVINTSSNSLFEQVVSNLPLSKAGTVHHVAAKESNENGGTLRISPRPRTMTTVPNSRNLMWNPYVVKQAPPERAAEPHDSQSSSKAASERADLFPAEPISQHQSFTMPTAYAPAAQFPTQGASAGAGKDPLWYLHSLPTANPNPLDTNDLKALAAEDTKTEATQKAAQASAATNTAPKPNSRIRDLVRELKASFHIPQWLLITLAVFMGGIGVFTLFGGLVLLKILFMQTRPPAFLPVNTAPVSPELASTPTVEPEKVGYASDPKAKRIYQTGIEDKSTVSALDYLKESSDNVAQAVHNAVLVKFPSQSRHRSGLKRQAGRPIGIEPTYSARP